MVLGSYYLTSGTVEEQAVRSFMDYDEMLENMANFWSVSFFKSIIIFLQGSFSFTGVSNMVIAALWAGGTVVTTSSLRPSRWMQL